jgi:two-component sensor histidine kinase
MLGYSRQDLSDLNLDSMGAQSIRSRLKDFRRLGRVRVEASARKKDGLDLRMIFHTAAMGDGSYQILLSKIEDPGAGGELLFEDAPLPLVEVSLSQGCVLVVNINRQARLLCGGGEPSNFAGRKFSSLFGLGDEVVQGLLDRGRNASTACEGFWLPDQEEAFGHYYKICIARRGQAGEGLVLSLCDITEEKKAVVEALASLKWKSILLKESNHRIKNGLGLLTSMISLQREAIGNEACSSLLLAVQSRIQTIAQFHDKLSLIHDQGLDLDLASYIQDIVRGAERAYLKSGSPVRVEMSIAPIELDAKRTATLGLIVNELLTNSFKYAYPGQAGGTIRVGAELSEGLITLRVSDDGAGLPPGFDWRASSGLGFQFIDALCQQLSAKVQVEGEGGFGFAMSFAV